MKGFLGKAFPTEWQSFLKGSGEYFFGSVYIKCAPRSWEDFAASGGCAPGAGV